MNKQLKNIRLCTYLLLVFAALLNFGCEKKDDFLDRRDEENTVKIIARSNIPQIPIRVYYAGGGGVVKDYWESEFSTKKYSILAMVQCEDVYQCEDKGKVLTIEIYVNGELKSKADGSSYVKTEVDIKKDRK